VDAIGFERWVAQYVKTHSWSVYDPASPRRRKYDEVVARREEALLFLRDHGADIRLDELSGDPAEVTLLNFAVRAEDEEFVLALVAAGASPTRIFVDPLRADEGPGETYVFQRPLWLARQRGLNALVTALATPAGLAVEADDERRLAAKTPAADAAWAQVYALRERWVFVPQSGGNGYQRWAPGATAIERTAASAAVAAALRKALGRFSTELSDDAGMKQAQRETLAAAGARSVRALNAVVSLLSVAQDDDKMLILRWRAEGSGHVADGEPIVLDRPVSDDAVVLALVRAATPGS